MSDEWRPITPAVSRVSPLAAEYGSLYPYRNMKQSGLTPYLNAFKRAIANFNPLAAPQVPSSEHVAEAIKNGDSIWVPDVDLTRSSPTLPELSWTLCSQVTTTQWPTPSTTNNIQLQVTRRLQSAELLAQDKLRVLPQALYSLCAELQDLLDCQ